MGLASRLGQYVSDLWSGGDKPAQQQPDPAPPPQQLPPANDQEDDAERFKLFEASKGRFGVLKNIPIFGGRFSLIDGRLQGGTYENDQGEETKGLEASINTLRYKKKVTGEDGSETTVEGGGPSASVRATSNDSGLSLGGQVNALDGKVSHTNAQGGKVNVGLSGGMGGEGRVHTRVGPDGKKKIVGGGADLMFASGDYVQDGEKQDGPAADEPEAQALPPAPLGAENPNTEGELDALCSGSTRGEDRGPLRIPMLSRPGHSIVNRGNGISGIEPDEDLTTAPEPAPGDNDLADLRRRLSQVRAPQQVPVTEEVPEPVRS